MATLFWGALVMFCLGTAVVLYVLYRMARDWDGHKR